MQFELTEEIINQIIFSMEDQNSRYMFDSENALPVPAQKAQRDSERYYVLPVWDSVNGFKIMECFVSALQNPPVREKLRTALFAGKGAFRAFKNVLKEHPEVENRWFDFKERALKREIIAWYNVLRDSWGLEKVGEEPEETDDLVCVDFDFRMYDAASDEPHIKKAAAALESEIRSLYPHEAAQAFWHLYRCSVPPVYGCLCTLTAYTSEGDFAGFVSAQPFPEGAQKTALVTDLYVFSAWRGLGLGKALFLRCVELLKNSGKSRIIVPAAKVPVFFEQAMFRSGFQRIPAGFFADTDTENI